MISVNKGFYVHYKGGIYFVTGIARNFDEGGDVLVVYESTVGCGDQLMTLGSSRELYAGQTHPNEMGHCYRPVVEFVEKVNAYDGSIPTSSTPLIVPRFQRVLGWVGGTPMVLVNGRTEPFVSRYLKD